MCYECLSAFDTHTLAPLTPVTCPTCSHETPVPYQVGKFWLFESLAAGGMGEVYKGFMEGRPERYYAIKILPRDKKDDPHLIDALRKEIAVNREIGEHPCTVRVEGSGQEGDEYYLATEFVAGEGLDKRIQREGALSEVDVLLIALRVLSAEAHIYQKGYLYRDLKPENILLAQSGESFLCDLGICMPIDEAVGIDESDLLQGSPLYIPPERILAEGEDAFSEIYSLGLVVFHAIVGRPYYQAEEVQSVAQMHVDSHSPEQQDQMMEGISLDLAEMLKIMIRRQPTDRYQTFLDVERDMFRIVVSRLYGQV